MKKIFWLFVIALAALACNGLSEAPTSAPLPATDVPVVATDVPVVIEKPPATEGEAVGAKAREHLEYLSVELGQRVAGSRAERLAQEYIVSQLEFFGYSPEAQEFSVFEDAEGYPIFLRSANVIAVKPGRSAKEIIVGAHYDSTYEAGLGADDNASSIGVLLETAEWVWALETPYTIRFIAFGAEEINLNGATAFVDQMTQAEINNTIAMINLDSIAAGDVAYIYSDEGSMARLRDWTLAWAEWNNLGLQTIYEVDLTYEGYGTSDHFPFQQAGIPFVYFEATNWALGDQDGYTQVSQEYGQNGKILHTRYDTLEYLDETFPGRVDERLNLFTLCLMAILTEYEE